MSKTKTGTKSTHQYTRNIGKVVGICVAIVAAAFALSASIWALTNPRGASSGMPRAEKDLMGRVETIELTFKSYPTRTHIVYDLKNKTKELSVGGGEAEDIEFYRFEEFFHSMYKSLFTNDQDLLERSECCALEPVYSVTVTFDGNEVPEPTGNNTMAYTNSKSQKPTWIIDGHHFPKGWSDVVATGEIDEDYFVESINAFDLHKTSYDD